MSLLTDQERINLMQATGVNTGSYEIAIARAIEAAVIARLATVSVEPDLIKTDEVDRYGDSIYIEAYSTEAIAAARVQEN